ncbi:MULTISPECIES: SSI family serine proteinase inhibitor [unclassified Streptomyces]|uniref:SSI family serine proteinase inhibitor n=1 Tax=unclassified Streptomyces TaxID=2593676 RepID=UPI00324C4F01
MTISTTAKAVRGGLLAAALLVAGAAPAQAAAQDFPPGNWLYLTVTKGDARSQHTHDTLLMCDPPEGHTRAAEACTELAAADGDISRIPPKDLYCPMIYAPVAVHARGEWSGRKIEYTQTFSSSCFMGAHTGSVFALDG